MKKIVIWLVIIIACIVILWVTKVSLFWRVVLIGVAVLAVSVEQILLLKKRKPLLKTIKKWMAEVWGFLQGLG